MAEEHIKIPKDLLHPLVAVQCEEYDTSNLSVYCMTVLKDKVYFYGEDKDNCLLYCAPLTDLTSLSKLSLPLDYDVRFSALTTYQSQLVLMGGRNSRKEFTNKVWASDDGHNWQQSFPSMLRCRCGPFAISCASPECLIVVGGDPFDSGTMTTVEVFCHGEWTSVHDLPGVLCSYSDIEGIIHNGNLHLYYSYEQGIYFCKVESLLASSTPVGEDGRACTLWRCMKCPPRCYYIFYSFLRFSLLSFEQQLLAVNEESIFVYSSYTQSWVLIGENPTGKRSLCAVTVSDYILLTTRRDDYNYLHKLKASVSSYDPDSDFSELNKGALSRLEAAGIPVVTSLEKLVKEKLPDMIITTDCNILEEFACSVISSASSFEPPTWKLLYEVLKELDPKGLSQDIEEYLSCPRSLKEQCTSAIIAVLLQQKSLEPDQIHVRLPDYVPPRVKSSVADVFKTYTLQSLPPILHSPPSE